MAESGLALMLLIGAGLMIRSFARLQSLQIGFSPDHVMTMRVELPKYKPEVEVSFDEQLLAYRPARRAMRVDPMIALRYE